MQIRGLGVIAMVIGCGTGAAPGASAPGPAPAPMATAPLPADAKAPESTPGLVVPPKALVFESSRRIATATEVCAVADSNLARAEAVILSLPPPRTGRHSTAWNRAKDPAGLFEITRRFGLDARDKALLDKHGFVVPARLAQPSYAWAYHEVYQSQLPIYVSADSILHAVYAAHDGMLSGIETGELAPRLKALLSAMHRALPAAASRYPALVARDLDVYLLVARSLIEDTAVASALGDAAIDREAQVLVAKAKASGAMEARLLFGRERVIDWSQYQPRGHYTEELAPYFRAVMWLSRLEFNIVSRSSRSSAPGEAPDPRETPREATDALALADLVEASGQRADFDRFEDVFGALAGRREDIPLPKLAALAKQGGVSDLHARDAAERLRDAVGDTFQRTARIHYMPQGSAILPAISTFIGPRITPDTVALRPLARSETPGRDRLHAGDIAYVLGQDRGKTYLAADLATFSQLGANLDIARKRLASAPRTDDLYTAWLDAIRALADKPAGAIPSHMDTPAFADFRMNTAVAAFAQLRHNHVLIAGQAYGEGGCEIPDGYVEPAPAVYDALARYADLGASKIALLGASSAKTRDYFVRLGQVARVLAVISRIELANQPLPEAARQWLSMVVEIEPYGSDGRPTYTGWYFDLFENRPDAIAEPGLIADFFTSPQAGVGYVGVKPPTMGIFVVDTHGGARAMVGPVAQAYEYQGPLAPRLTDRTARELAPAKQRSPWTASYIVPAPPEPSFTATLENEWRDDGTQISFMLIESKQPIDALTIQQLDHHRVPLAATTHRIPRGKSKLRLHARDGTSMFGFIAGAFRGWGEMQCIDGCSAIGFGSYRAQRVTEE